MIPVRGARSPHGTLSGQCGHHRLPGQRLGQRHRLVQGDQAGLVGQAASAPGSPPCRSRRTPASTWPPARPSPARRAGPADAPRSRSPPWSPSRPVAGCPAPTDDRCRGRRSRPTGPPPVGPSWYTHTAAPMSPCCAKFAANASRTGSNPAATSPLIVVMRPILAFRLPGSRVGRCRRMQCRTDQAATGSA